MPPRSSNRGSDGGGKSLLYTVLLVNDSEGQNKSQALDLHGKPLMLLPYLRDSPGGRRATHSHRPTSIISSASPSLLKPSPRSAEDSLWRLPTCSSWPDENIPRVDEPVDGDVNVDSVVKEEAYEREVTFLGSKLEAQSGEGRHATRSHSLEHTNKQQHLILLYTKHGRPRTCHEGSRERWSRRRCDLRRYEGRPGSSEHGSELNPYTSQQLEQFGLNMSRSIAQPTARLVRLPSPIKPRAIMKADDIYSLW